MQFNLPSFLSCLINFSITKREHFVFEITSFCLVKKYTEMVLSKRYSHFRFVKIYTEIGQNIYDVDKKSESSFETCCLLTFFNECLSPDKFQLKSNNSHVLRLTCFATRHLSERLVRRGRAISLACGNNGILFSKCDQFLKSYMNCYHILW